MTHKWEYCQLTGCDSESAACTLCFFTTTTTQKFSIKQGAWEQALAQLGLDGWEVVGLERGTLFLKRVLP